MRIRLAREDKMSIDRLHRITKRLARKKIIAQIYWVVSGICRAVFVQPTACRDGFAVLFIVPVLRHNKFGRQRHNLFMSGSDHRRTEKGMMVLRFSVLTFTM